MPLASGTRLGHYEIQSQLGAGGMGEVYRAKDTKLERIVAIKVLPGQMAQDPESLARFEREAKAVAALSHPNILAIFDFGMHDGVSYAAMELLEGESLRARLTSGPLQTRKAVDLALQVCQGLGAAHNKGIIHRDLKPDNLFLTKDGRLKILDFGLAKIVKPAYPHERETMELVPPTDPGTVMGTVGYMSPEQVRAEDVDQRSDIFSFGAILYEMLSGRRAFKGGSAVETMSAILKEDPPDLIETNRTLNPALERVVRHCLEKHPEARFQSARDLAFQLETISGISAVTATKAMPGLPRAMHRVAWPMLLVAAAGGLLAGLATARLRPAALEPRFRQLTFQTGTISAARFAPDGQIVYSGAFLGQPMEILTTWPERPESRALDLPSAGLLGISSQGEMAVALGCAMSMSGCRGTLARAWLSGGAPREILKDVRDAEWAPDGKDLAIVREVSGHQQIEFPIGKKLYESAGWVSHLRFSPDGELLAFLDHKSMGDDAGAVSVVDRSGQARVLAGGWGGVWGLAWHPSGRELWFTAVESGLVQPLRAVDLAGKQRLVLRAPTRLILQDISKTGQVLFARESAHGGLMCLRSGETREQDLSWFDWSSMARISDDGKSVLFCERGEGTGGISTIYMRPTDGAAAVRLGEGRPLALSPDGQWAAATSLTGQKLMLLPTGAGDPREIPTEPLTRVIRATWFPKSNRLLLLATEKDHQRRCYVLDLEKGTPRPVSAEGQGVDFLGDVLSPDEKLFAATGADGVLALHPVDGNGAPQPVPEAPAGTVPVQWSPDGKTLYLLQRDSLPARVLRLQLATKTVEPWKEILPGDPTGIVRIPNVDLSADGSSYVYTYSHRLSELYLADGLQ